MRHGSIRSVVKFRLIAEPAEFQYSSVVAWISSNSPLSEVRIKSSSSMKELLDVVKQVVAEREVVGTREGQDASRR